MNDASSFDPAQEAIEQQSAAWVLRHDRGLSPAEQDEFSEWLAADPRHGEQLARHRRHWRRLDHLGQWRPEHSSIPNPDLLAPASRSWLWRLLPRLVPFAAAAALAVAYYHGRSPANAPLTGDPATAATTHRTLEDGSTVELNRGAVIRTNLSAAVRRVELEQGEAFFNVAKDPSRPFIVAAHGVEVRAVGTAFNVRLNGSSLEVLVTEGRVQVDASPTAPAPLAGAPAAARPLVPLLEANQRVVVSLAPQPAPPRIATLRTEEIGRMLSWQQRVLNFTAAPLAEVVAEFNRHNAMQIQVVDPELASIKISATFRPDNIDGFVRLLEAGFEARVERRGSSEILLRKAIPAPARP